jgi:hypothetical protein
MAVRTSTGYEARILGPQAFDDIFRDGCIEIRSTPQPDTADHAAAGVLLARVTADGGAWTAGNPTNGLRYSRDGRFATKNLLQRWVLQGVGTGVAGHFRVLPNAYDAGAESTVHPRIDGAIGLVDTEGDYQLLLPTLAITPSTIIELPSWWFTTPLQ